MAGNFTFGIEEEYFLVDAETKLVVRRAPEAFFKSAAAASRGRISREFLQAQVEVITSPHANMAEARAELRDLRQTVAAVAADHGLGILAAGTHPTAVWSTAVQTPKERYDAVMDDLQMIGQRDMLCGMHVHVEVPDPDGRINVMCRMIPYVPLFLALSTSSPFWQSRRTGLKGYRLAAYDELPRSGLPALFRTKEEFDAYVAALVRSGVIDDSSYIWWAIRPSLHHPTLELRAPDCCTLVEDSIAIAALYRTLVRHLYVNPWRNADIGGRKQMAGSAPWRARHLRDRGGRNLGCRDARSGHRGHCRRCRGARLYCRGKALPRHRRRRHLGRRAACGVRGAKSQRQPRGGIARGHRLDRVGHIAVSFRRCGRHRRLHHQPARARTVPRPAWRRVRSCRGNTGRLCRRRCRRAERAARS